MPLSVYMQKPSRMSIPHNDKVDFVIGEESQFLEGLYEAVKKDREALEEQHEHEGMGDEMR